MSYEEYQGEEQSVHNHTDHNFQDRVQLAGDVVPLPVKPGPNAGPAGHESDFEGRIKRSDSSNVKLPPLDLFKGYQDRKSSR